MEQGTLNIWSDRPLASSASQIRPGSGAARENRTVGSQSLATKEWGLYSSTMEQAIKEAIDRAMGSS